MKTMFTIAIFGIIALVGMGIFYVFVVLPDTNDVKITEIECNSEDGCGKIIENTMSDDEKQQMIEELDKNIRGIALDLDGNRIVELDVNGIPVVYCDEMENNDWIIDENCKVTLK